MSDFISTSAPKSIRVPPHSATPAKELPSEPRAVFTLSKDQPIGPGISAAMAALSSRGHAVYYTFVSPEEAKTAPLVRITQPDGRESVHTNVAELIRGVSNDELKVLRYMYIVRKEERIVNPESLALKLGILEDRLGEILESLREKGLVSKWAKRNGDPVGPEIPSSGYVIRDEGSFKLHALFDETVKLAEEKENEKKFHLAYELRISAAKLSSGARSEREQQDKAARLLIRYADQLERDGVSGTAKYRKRAGTMLLSLGDKAAGIAQLDRARELYAKMLDIAVRTNPENARQIQTEITEVDNLRSS